MKTVQILPPIDELLPPLSSARDKNRYKKKSISMQLSRCCRCFGAAAMPKGFNFSFYSILFLLLRAQTSIDSLAGFSFSFLSSALNWCTMNRTDRWLSTKDAPRHRLKALTVQQSDSTKERERKTTVEETILTTRTWNCRINSTTNMAVYCFADCSRVNTVSRHSIRIFTIFIFNRFASARAPQFICLLHLIVSFVHIIISPSSKRANVCSIACHRDVCVFVAWPFVVVC